MTQADNLGCGAPSQDEVARAGIPAGETVVQGTVTVAGEPARSTYVRLLDATGEFTAEVVAGDTGAYRFFVRPGKWTVRALSPKGTAESSVEVAAAGDVVQAPLAIA